MLKNVSLLVVVSWSFSSFAATDNSRVLKSQHIQRNVDRIARSVPKSFPYSKSVKSMLEMGVLSANRKTLAQLDSILGDAPVLVRVAKIGGLLRNDLAIEIVGAGKTVRFEEFTNINNTQKVDVQIRQANAKEIELSQNPDRAKKAAARSRRVNKLKNSVPYIIVTAAISGAAVVAGPTLGKFAEFVGSAFMPF